MSEKDLTHVRYELTQKAEGWAIERGAMMNEAKQLVGKWKEDKQAALAQIDTLRKQHASLEKKYEETSEQLKDAQTELNTVRKNIGTTSNKAMEDLLRVGKWMFSGRTRLQ